ncbi:MAG: hypothetical protein LBS75_06965 [Synergistaceae bacterium]|jgi:hypothetical protein|nr:hypothetical protein [Synergistaceae bacterium]
MPRIKAVTDAMIEKSKTIKGRADALLESQKSVSGIVSGMGQNFSGKMPSLMLRNMLSMRGKYTEINENLTEYSGFLEHAANEYEWTEAEMTKLMQSIGSQQPEGGGKPVDDEERGGRDNDQPGDDDGDDKQPDDDDDGGGDDDGEDEEGEGGGEPVDDEERVGRKRRRRRDGHKGDGRDNDQPGDGSDPTDPVEPPAEPEPVTVGTQIPGNPTYNVYINLGQSQSYAIGRAQELSGVTINWYGGSPDAQNWIGSASNLTQTGTPSIGSIIQWLFGEVSGGSGLGNVGVVEGLNPIYDSSGSVSDYEVLYSMANQGGSSSSSFGSSSLSSSSGSAASVSSGKLSDMRGIGVIFLQLFFQLLFGGGSAGGSVV